MAGSCKDFCYFYNRLFMEEEEVQQPVKKKRRYTKLIIVFWLFVLAPFIGLFVLLSQASNSDLPTFEELENPKSNLATEIISADHKLLGKYFVQNRTNVKYEELSPYLIDALIATEDERYRDHSGIDFKGLMRAAVYMGEKGGASTITQQLAKMLFTEQPASKWDRVKQKFREWIIAVRLEKQYTKEEIVTMYLNRFDFVNNAVGIKSAAAVYFDSSPDSLKMEEAAMLVGMAKNPALFNPLRRPDTTLHRRNVVFGQMLKNQLITQDECDSLSELPLGLNYQIVDHNEGPAPYFRERLRIKLQELLTAVDTVNDKLMYPNPETGKPYDIYKDGLKVYTTIDSRFQEYAEWAVREHLGAELQPQFNEELKKKNKSPFHWNTPDDEIDKIMEFAKKRSKRYESLVGKECPRCTRRINIEKEEMGGHSYFVCQSADCEQVWKAPVEDSIDIIFNTPINMKVFSWAKGEEHKYEKDTIMSPMDSIRYYKGFLQAGLMSMDPHTGFIKAWVGGINHHHFKYDHVDQGARQVGSTFKPFVYATALERFPPCHEVPNVQVTFDKDKWNLPKDWSPKNSDAEYGGIVSLKYGLANSMNTITAWIIKQFGPGAGPEAVVRLARKMGVKSPLEPVPSLCLGVADLTVYEMVGANSTFANKGVYIEPIMVTRIEDKHGNVIMEVIPKITEAMDEESAYAMLTMMKGVCDGAYNRTTGTKSGTGVRLKIKSSHRPYSGFKYPVAGKTGTTQNNSDGWFMGLTPDLVTGVWVGAEDRSVHFSSTANGQGANMALPIWGYYMHKVYGDESIKLSRKDFEAPVGRLDIETNCGEHFENVIPTEPDFGEGEEDEDEDEIF